MNAPLQTGDVLAARFLRRLSDGSPVRVGTNRQRPQVVVLTHAEPCQACAAYLGSFESVAELLRVERADVIAVVGEGWQQTAVPVPVVAAVDDGVVGRRLSADGAPVIVVADRFGQLFDRFEAGPEHRFPTHEGVLASLLDIAIRCPECGVPDVPSPEVLPDVGTRSGGMSLGQG